MSASFRAKTAFTAGELAPELLGRVDLRAYEAGARRLRNVFIQPTGGVTRRPGLRHVATLPGEARLIPFEVNAELTYLFVLTDGLLSIYTGDVRTAQMAAPWTGPMLPQIAWTQSADAALILHPGMAPQRISRNGAGWTLAAWPLVREPFHRFADGAVTLTTSATAGIVTVNASAPVFSAGHLGARIRIGGKRLVVSTVNSPSIVSATVLDAPLTGTAATAAWDEAAFSDARGWPVTACFHQQRLVIGGTRDLPNRLFLSRTAASFDFDPGTGLDDEGIDFALVSDQANAIRGVFSGRHLQVFTSGSEWMVTGEPLTPSSIQLTRQTRVGSRTDRMLPTVDVDGATIFASRSGQGVHEFTYTDLQQVYQANDLAILARHLVQGPRALAYDASSRLLHMAMADGALATLTIYRAEQVTAWTRQETDGLFRDLAEIDGTIWALVDRAGSQRLERFDRTLGLDAATTFSGTTPRASFAGLGHLEGRTVGLVADGAPRDPALVTGSAVALSPTARSGQVGLRFTHRIEPMPATSSSNLGPSTGPQRSVTITFRLLETGALTADVGRGLRSVPFRRLDLAVLDAAPAPFTGDVTLGAIGWRRGGLEPPWRIEGDTPLPLTLLSVTTEARTPN
jgi:hypothetical protein